MSGSGILYIFKELAVALKRWTQFIAYNATVAQNCRRYIEENHIVLARKLDRLLSESSFMVDNFFFNLILQSKRITASVRVFYLLEEKHVFVVSVPYSSTSDMYF